MHRTWRFSVKEDLQAGTNQIRILFRSVLQYIKDYIENVYKYYNY